MRLTTIADAATGTAPRGWSSSDSCIGKAALLQGAGMTKKFWADIGPEYVEGQPNPNEACFTLCVEASEYDRLRAALERIATVTHQTLVDMRAQGVLIEWDTPMEDALTFARAALADRPLDRLHRMDQELAAPAEGSHRIPEANDRADAARYRKLKALALDEDSLGFENVTDSYPDEWDAKLDAMDRPPPAPASASPNMADHTAAAFERARPVVTQEMVDRFLAWRLPEDFAPDGGVEFRRSIHGSWPVGTNLLTAAQAHAMLEHVLGVAVQPSGGSDAAS